jgi:hypothetical protein
LTAQANASAQAPQATGDLITFDVPGASQGTFPGAISPAEEIGGYFCNATACPGFVRDGNGNVTTFLESDRVFVSGTNPPGAIVGYFCDFSLGTCASFVRDPNGTITLINFSSSVLARSINPSGEIAGYYGDATGFHSFVRTSGGAVTTFDVPGGVGATIALAIDPGGAVSGAWSDANVVTHGFLRASGGSLTTFDPPNWNEPGSFLQVSGMTPADDITGYYCPGFTGACQGFLRTHDGTFVTFNPPGSTFTFVAGINQAGTIIGQYFDADGVPHGYLRSGDGTFSTIDVPGAVSGSTSPNAISVAGAITGTWSDNNNVVHGFLFRPK